MRSSKEQRKDPVKSHSNCNKAQPAEDQRTDRTTRSERDIDGPKEPFWARLSTR